MDIFRIVMDNFCWKLEGRMEKELPMCPRAFLMNSLELISLLVRASLLMRMESLFLEHWNRWRSWLPISVITILCAYEPGRSTISVKAFPTVDRSSTTAINCTWPRAKPSVSLSPAPWNHQTWFSTKKIQPWARLTTASMTSSCQTPNCRFQSWPLADLLWFSWDTIGESTFRWSKPRNG